MAIAQVAILIVESKVVTKRNLLVKLIPIILVVDNEVCEKIISKGTARNIDPCLIEELEALKNEYPKFKEKFQLIMSCCGHGKYPKTIIVKNRYSRTCFEWLSGVTLSGTRRSDSKAPFYKRDKEGHYYIPEIR